MYLQQFKSNFLLNNLIILAYLIYTYYKTHKIQKLFLPSIKKVIKKKFTRFITVQRHLLVINFGYF